MTKNQNTTAINKIQATLEEARKCIQSIPFDLDQAKNKLDDVKHLWIDLLSDIIEKHHNIKKATVLKRNTSTTQALVP